MITQRSIMLALRRAEGLVSMLSPGVYEIYITRAVTSTPLWNNIPAGHSVGSRVRSRLHATQESASKDVNACEFMPYE